MGVQCEVAWGAAVAAPTGSGSALGPVACRLPARAVPWHLCKVPRCHEERLPGPYRETWPGLPKLVGSGREKGRLPGLTRGLLERPTEGVSPGPTRTRSFLLPTAPHGAHPSGHLPAHQSLGAGMLQHGARWGPGEKDRPWRAEGVPGARGRSSGMGIGGSDP